MADVLDFARHLDALGVPLFTAPVGGAEFRRPDGWQTMTAEGNRARLAGFTGGALCAVLGSPLAVVDVDTKNGADAGAAVEWLHGLDVPILANVATPGAGGRHLYVPGHPDLPSVAAQAGRDGLDGLPGVEILSHGRNVFAPGTLRPKYDGRGYAVLADRLADYSPAMLDHGARLAEWVATHRAVRVPKLDAGPPAPVWDGRAPDARERAYLSAALDRQAADVASTTEGGRNLALYTAALKLGSFVSGAGLDEAAVWQALAASADACGLTRDDGPASVRSTIRSGLANGRRNPRAVPTDHERVSVRQVCPMDTPDPDPERIDPATGEVLDADAEASGPSLDDRVFGASEVLAHVRQAAHARLVTPWAVLGALLARVVAEVPPHVVLPPLVGSDASLNLAVALVADSGGGKSGALACARDALRIPNRRAADIGPGSGEGIMMQFLERDPDTKENVLKAHPLALLSADEIAQIGAVQGRNSQATFGPVVRSMLTGDQVSTTAVDTERRRRLPRNGYRLCVVAGVQPKLSGVLLDDSDGGTPQRWLWLPADDPGWNAPDTEWPAPLSWTFPRPPAPDPDGFVRIDVPEEARAAVVDARRRRLRREGDPLDGHRLLTREKVAAALALLHGGFTVTSAWWELSGLVMHRSDVTRAYCAEALAAKAEHEHRARGRLDAARESGAREARTDDAMKYARALWRYVSTGKHPNARHEAEEGCTARCLSHALRHHKDADRGAAVALAVDLAWIDERAGRYFPGAAQPTEAGGAA